MPVIGSSTEQFARNEFQGGNFEVVGAASLVYQPKQEDGKEPRAAKLVVELTLQGYDENWNRLDEGEHEGRVTKNISCGNKALLTISPGVVENIEDPEPEDQGTNVGARGNTFFSEKAGAGFHEKSAWARLSTSLQVAGFDKQVLNHSYLTGLVGARLTLASESDKMKDQLGRETVFSWIVATKYWPNENVKGGKGGKGATGKAATTAKGNTPIMTPSIADAGRYLRELVETAAGKGKSLSVTTGIAMLQTSFDEDLVSENFAEMLKIARLEVKKDKLVVAG